MTVVARVLRGSPSFLLVAFAATACGGGGDSNLNQFV